MVTMTVRLKSLFIMNLLIIFIMKRKLNFSMMMNGMNFMLNLLVMKNIIITTLKLILVQIHLLRNYQEMVME
jgi:hypothetical protein